MATGRAGAGVALTRITPAVLAAALVASLALAGCLDDGGPGPEGPTIVGEPTDEPRSAGEMWMVWVHGNETLDPDPGFVCDVAFDHQVSVGEERVLFEDSAYSFDPGEVTYLVAFDLWEEPTDCPLVYDLHWDGSSTARAMGAWGNLSLAPDEDGTLRLGGQTSLQPGQTAIYTYETTEKRGGERVHVQGTFRVEHLGAWPQDGLQPS